MSLFKNPMALITEMSRGECPGKCNDDLTVDLTHIDFSALLDDMQSISMGELKFTEAMVTVRECSRLGFDLVEIDELAKYMQSNKIRNFKEAIENIAEHCERDASKFAIVIDESAIKEAIQEAEYTLKCPDDILRKAKINGIVDTKKVLDMLYDNGLNVVKKS